MGQGMTSLGGGPLRRALNFIGKLPSGAKVTQMTIEVGMSSCLPTESEIDAVVSVLRSGNLRQGPMVERFEQAFCDQFGARHAVACASGTAALHLAYSLVLKPGEEVLVPGYTFLATASMVVAARATPVMCDIDPETLLIDINDAEARITPRTRAIAPVHLFGNCCERDQIESLARRYDLKIIWDAAQAHGSSWKSQDVASWSSLVCFSSYATKNLSTGEGGMICTDNADWAAQLRRLRSHGQDDAGAWQDLGYNYRLSDIHAALGVAQLKRFGAMADTRRQHAERLRRGLQDLPGIRFQRTSADAIHSWHRFAILVDSTRFGLSRDVLASYLASEKIGSSAYYGGGLHREPYVGRTIGPQSLSETERIAQTVLCLPNHHDLTSTDVDRVIAAVHQAHSRKGRLDA